MFDLITGKVAHIPGGGTGPVLVSSALHVGGLALIVIVPLLFVSTVLPQVPTMMAFVAEAPAPPPPPPPPPMAARQPDAPSVNPNAAPVEAPRQIEPETPAQLASLDRVEGVEGGIPGGVIGGIVGGIPDVPPPPPPPPAPVAPVRVGGAIKTPTLLTRVEPTYPALAVSARVEGTVILEAVVNEQGQVTSVRVLRSIPLLDRAAIGAVEQWRYTPVILNGRPVPFMLTVVLTFSIPTTSNSAKY